MNELHLFAGVGGGILAGHLLGHRCVCAVENAPYAQAILLARQNDGTFPPFPIWDDVQTFDGKPWRGVVDVVCGGFPCQDISAAGRGAGIDGERSGLWREMARIIGEVLPQFVIVENSPVLTSRGLGIVLGDLAEMGFDAQWGVLGAHHTGAPHKRDRIWIVANASGRRLHEQEVGKMEQQRGAETIGPGNGPEALANPHGMRESQSQGGQRDERGWSGHSSENMANPHSHAAQRMESRPQPSADKRPIGLHGGAGGFPAWPADPADAPESRMGRVAHGVAHRMDRLKAIGNGQVPRVAAAAFNILKELK